MLPKHAHSLGGKVMAVRQRELALKEYRENPNICKYCGKEIDVGDHQKVSMARKKKFCNRRCAASFNNRENPKRRHVEKVSSCQRCGKEIPETVRQGGSYYLRKFCPECRYSDIQTKGEAFSNKQNRINGHRYIREAARSVALGQGWVWCCKICGYTKLVEVCHIKPVQKFSDDTLLTEINSPSNLILLCRNHHWEFDHDKEFRKTVLEKLESAGGVEPPTQSV